MTYLTNVYLNGIRHPTHKKRPFEYQATGLFYYKETKERFAACCFAGKNENEGVGLKNICRCFSAHAQKGDAILNQEQQPKDVPRAALLETERRPEPLGQVRQVTARAPGRKRRRFVFCRLKKKKKTRRDFMSPLSL